MTHSLEPFDPDKEYEVAEAHDDTDVAAVLDLETHDGKGGAVVPKADFVSYAADVEEEDK